MSVQDVLSGLAPWHADCADVLAWLRSLPDDCADLVCCSPPYEKARLYLERGQDLKIARGTEAWVSWLVEVAEECRRVCKGLCVFVVEGQTKNFRWSAGPALFMADLHRKGFNLRKPPAFHRVGIPGSGGPDWFRNDYEFCVCFSRPGELPWSDNTACGHPPKWAPGGAMSSRLTDGSRVNQWGHSIDSGATVVAADGLVTSEGKRPSHVLVNGRDQWGGTGHKSSGEGRKVDGEHKGKGKHIAGGRRITSGHVNGDTPNADFYSPPVLANPGNVFSVIVGGGCMGHKLAHVNEAPFPESLVEMFVLSCSAPGSIVCDPFTGSGTTGAVAFMHGRRFLGCDLRQSQVDLACKRIADTKIAAGPVYWPHEDKVGKLEAEVAALKKRLAEAEEALAHPLFGRVKA